MDMKSIRIGMTGVAILLSGPSFAALALRPPGPPSIFCSRPHGPLICSRPDPFCPVPPRVPDLSCPEFRKVVSTGCCR